MVFAAEQGFTARRETQAGDVFARALIADSLCDAKALAGSPLEGWIAYEADYLLSTRRPGPMDGWSYFPDLPELPPDADDLAQVMQVLLRSGRRDDVTATCEPALRVLLTDGAHPDGSFETWIIPAAGRTTEQQRQAEFVRLAWGRGPDSEVMANLLYALALYDPARFQDAFWPRAAGTSRPGRTRTAVGRAPGMKGPSTGFTSACACWMPSCRPLPRSSGVGDS